MTFEHKAKTIIFNFENIVKSRLIKIQSINWNRIFKMLMQNKDSTKIKFCINEQMILQISIAIIKKVFR